MTGTYINPLSLIFYPLLLNIKCKLNNVDTLLVCITNLFNLTDPIYIQIWCLIKIAWLAFSSDLAF